MKKHEADATKKIAALLAEQKAEDGAVLKLQGEFWAKHNHQQHSLKHQATLAAKAALAQAKAEGYTRLLIHYEGAGDSGCIDGHQGWKGKGPFGQTHEKGKHPPTFVEGDAFYSGTKHPMPTWMAALDEYVYTILPGGWELDAGSYGEAVINVLDGTVTLQHNERFEDSTYSENDFQIGADDE